jgi:hypothetical protein
VCREQRRTVRWRSVQGVAHLARARRVVSQHLWCSIRDGSACLPPINGEGALGCRAFRCEPHLLRSIARRGTVPSGSIARDVNARRWGRGGGGGGGQTALLFTTTPLFTNKGACIGTTRTREMVVVMGAQRALLLTTTNKGTRIGTTRTQPLQSPRCAESSQGPLRSAFA